MSTASFTAAMAKAQAEMKNAVMDRENTHYKSVYASWRAFRDAVVPTLAKHGVVVLQPPILEYTAEGKMLAGCETIVMFDDKEQHRSKFLLPVTRADAHGAAGATTMAMRYALRGVACIASEFEQDDDGNDAADLPPGGTRELQVPRPQTNDTPSPRVLLHNEILAWAGFGPNDKDAVRDFIRKAAAKAGVTVNGKTMTDAEAGKVLAWVKTQREGNVDAFDATGGA